MRALLGLGLFLVMTAQPAEALDKYIGATNSFSVWTLGTDDAGSPYNVSPAPTLVFNTDFVVKVQCANGTVATIDGTGDTIAHKRGGLWIVTTNDTITCTAEQEAEAWTEGAGSYAGLVAYAPVAFKAITSGLTINGTLDAAEVGFPSGTVVSSADCANSATLFDTSLAAFYSGTNGPREAGILFTSGALANEVRRIGGYNTNGCVSINQAFSGTPAAGDVFKVVNQ
jgi:hypothetical protein